MTLHHNTYNTILYSTFQSSACLAIYTYTKSPKKKCKWSVNSYLRQAAKNFVSPNSPATLTISSIHHNQNGCIKYEQENYMLQCYISDALVVPLKLGQGQRNNSGNVQFDATVIM